MKAAGFNIRPGTSSDRADHAGGGEGGEEMARKLLEKGIYVIGFSFPVVAEGKARIRVQLSAGHRSEHIDQAVGAFTAVAREMGVW
jgi:glycine C-acetyltransferase